MNRTEVDAASLWIYWDAVSRGDCNTAVGTAVALIEAGLSVMDVLELVVVPAQAEVGRRWAANEWTVAEEHRATSIGEDVIAALARLVSPAPRDRGTAIVSCVDGEWHSLPARLIGVGLAAAGWETHYLGASVPAAQLGRFVQDLGPDVVALSCSMSTSLRRARWMIEASRDAGVPVLAGGAGFGPSGRWALELGANATAASVGPAVAALTAPDWPTFTGPALPLGTRGEMAERLALARGSIVRAAVSVLGHIIWDDGTDYMQDLGYLVDSLTSTVLVGDETLDLAFREWMIDVRTARGENREDVERRADEIRRQAEAEVGALAPAFG